MTPFEARDATVAIWQFLELADEVRPVDHLGRVGDLRSGTVSVAQTIPPVVETDPASEGKLTQRGREFGDGANFTGVDNLIAGVTDHTRLVRDVTVRAWIDYKIENHINGDVGVVCVRGINSGTDPERELWGMELERVDASNLLLRARWQAQTGVQAVLAGVSFLKPAGFFHIAVARRWVSTDEVTARYYVNDRFIGEEKIVVAAQNNIGEGFGGTLIIGSRGIVNDFTDHLPDDTVIDHLSIEGDEMPAEELRSDYLRAAVSQPSGYARLRAYMPTGFAWTRRVESRIQRYFAAIGDILGDAISEANRLHDDFLPDRAYGRTLAKWELITGLSPLASDSIQDRRNAILGFLRRILGYQIDDIKFSLEPLFGLDSADIEIVEYDALRTDDFSVDDIAAPPSRIWITTQGFGSITIAAGLCSVSINAALPAQWFQGGFAPHRKASLSAALGSEPNRAALITEMSTIVTADSPALIGHCWITPEKDVMWLGVRQTGGVRELASFSVVGGVASAFTTLVTPFATDPFFLHTSYLGGGLYNFRHATAAIGPYSADVAVAGPSAPRYVGFGAVHQADAGAGGAISADFDDAQIYEPEGLRSFNWQAYRDPALPGQYSIENAQVQLEKQGPAHRSVCAVIEKTQGMELGPTGEGKLGCDPLYPADQIIS